ncbi:MAG: hypothetical protein ABI120_21385, partial [Gemmatimonadaceae bacterium]
VDGATLERGAIADGVVSLMSPLDALQDMAHVTIDADAEMNIRHGRSIPADVVGARAVLMRADAHIIAIANRTETDRWQPKVVLPLGDAE